MGSTISRYSRGGVKVKVKVNRGRIICIDCKEYHGWEIGTYCGELEYSCLGCGLCYSVDGLPAEDEGA